ncbi:MAG: TfoX family protein [Gemmatimonadales bacterium]|nr:MAG: TfoX family protein [Gemmatimonadales bacterium]
MEQLGRVVTGTIRSRRMFGGVGVYAGERGFALIDDDIIYLKADDLTVPAFEAEGLPPFRPFGEGTKPMKYYTVPVEWLDDVELLGPWAARALEAADRGKKRRAKGRRRGAF